MPANLEGGEGKSSNYHFASGISYPMAESGDVVLQCGEDRGEPAEEEAEARDECELYEGKSRRLWKGIEYRFGGCICESTRHIPYNTQSLQEKAHQYEKIQNMFGLEG